MKLHKSSDSDSNKNTRRLPLTVDGASGEVLPTPSRVNLHNMHSVRREMAKIYRAMKGGKMPKEEGSKLAYVLMQYAELVKLAVFEDRVKDLEKANGGRAR